MEGSIISAVFLFLLQDAGDSVKLWDITKGVVVEDFGKVFVKLRLLI